MTTALITGASAGIGEAFAQELAARQWDLILVARSQNKLEQLAQQLREEWSIQAEVISQDLSAAGAGQTLFDAVVERGLTVDLLVNNAGIGDYGAFARGALSKQLTMIQLNITALVELSGLFLPGMLERRSGAIINLSSVAGFQPLPYLSVYAATKAFVLNFSEALWAELQGTGVQVLALCPGPTGSEFFEKAKFPAAYRDQTANFTSPEQVVRDALEALARKQSTLVTGGLGNQLLVNIPRLLPRELLVSLVEKRFRTE